jgi:hypothetical protein
VRRNRGKRYSQSTKSPPWTDGDFIDRRPSPLQRVWNPADVGAEAGDRVVARIAGWDEDDPDDRASNPWIEGFLAVIWVETLGYWSFSVAGRTVDPESVLAAK